MRKDDRRTSTCGLFTCKLVVYESTMLLSRNCSKYMTSCEKGSDTIESIENSNLRKARFIIFHYNQSKQSSALSTYSSTHPVEKSFTESLDFSFYHGLCLSHTATLPLRNMSRCRRHATWILSFRLSWPRWPVRRYFEKTPSIHGIFQGAVWVQFCTGSRCATATHCDSLFVSCSMPTFAFAAWHPGKAVTKKIEKDHERVGAYAPRVLK